MRSLGRKYLFLAEQQRKLNETEAARENYKKSVESFSKSLAINAFQPDAWFSLGCAAQAADDFTTAVRAFRRKVDMDPEVDTWGKRFLFLISLPGFPVLEQSCQRTPQTQRQAQGILCPQGLQVMTAFASLIVRRRP
jgi:tetratricopeptide (TPR) repeat protein